LRAWLAAIIATAKPPLDQSALAQSAFFTDDKFEPTANEIEAAC
jgi:hypothetical protein